MTDPVLATIDNVLHDFEVSGDAMRWTPEPPARPQVQITQAQIVAIRRSGIAAAAAFDAAMKSITKTIQQAGKVFLKFSHQVMEHDRARCRVCRPYSNPRPLAFGAEYRRRSKRR